MKDESWHYRIYVCRDDLAQVYIPVILPHRSAMKMVHSLMRRLHCATVTSVELWHGEIFISQVNPKEWN